MCICLSLSLSLCVPVSLSLSLPPPPTCVGVCCIADGSTERDRQTDRDRQTLLVYMCVNDMGIIVIVIATFLLLIHLILFSFLFQLSE